MSLPYERKLVILSPYMEVVGPFAELEEHDGALFAEIAGHSVVLPRELKDALAPHLGSRIAILRTDIPGKEYLIRSLPEREAKYCARDVEKGRAHTHSIFL